MLKYKHACGCETIRINNTEVIFMKTCIIHKGNKSKKVYIALQHPKQQLELDRFEDLMIYN